MRRQATAILAGMALIAAGCSGTAALGCTREIDPATSVARMWNEALLDAIRRDAPAPTVHARNLFHVSAAMWDAWAVYDPIASGFFVDERYPARDVTAAREEAISYAAYRVLSHRFARSPGAAESLGQFEATMASLCFPTAVTNRIGNSPSAVGNRIAAAAIAFGRTDGSNELDGYRGDYAPVNLPLFVAQPGNAMVHANAWQPLLIPRPTGDVSTPRPQRFLSPHWDEVTPFAIESFDDLDPGPPPYLGDPLGDSEFKESVIEVIRYSSLLDPREDRLIDIGPASAGDNTLGANDGDGRETNPMTGEPYEPNMVALGDFARVLAEFWADGPNSETPPGHWNTLANAVSDSPLLVRRIGGEGAEVDRLEWDVKLYFALNGAVHDAAIVAWWAKGYYDYTRPISMIRYMGGLGQSTDPAAASFHSDGLPLVAGLVEVISEASSAPGQRHAHLADYVGEVGIRAWRGGPDDPETAVGGVGWIRAVDWMPYQKATFVTPPFPGYVSGHSTFSRAAAEVLTAFTGDGFFPGGLGEWTVPPGSLAFEAGPVEPVTLQWATYYDAADQAGLSRLYGGIHVRADDFAGRVMGSICGAGAWEQAQRYWAGTAGT
jgi:hypothetical protein